jgi:thioredoxin-related protein
MKRLIVILLIFIPSILLSGQSKAVKWYTIEEAQKLNEKHPRPVFIDTFTDWCGWCKKLDKDVFSDPVIAEILNKEYYPVKFNAESDKPIMFMGKQFVNDGTLNGAHQFAYALLKGKLSYPTVVFLNKKLEIITPVPGYRSAKEFEPLLKYFAGDVWQTQSFEEFSKTFTGKIQ